MLKYTLVAAIIVTMILTSTVFIHNNSSVYADGQANSEHHFWFTNAGGPLIPNVIHVWGNALTKTYYDNGNLVAYRHSTGGIILRANLPANLFYSCGPSGKYYTSSGATITIGGYVQQAVWCHPDYICRDYTSTQVKTFPPSFQPITGYQQWCICLRFPYVYFNPNSGCVRSPNSGTYSIQ